MNFLYLERVNKVFSNTANFIENELMLGEDDPVPVIKEIGVPTDSVFSKSISYRLRQSAEEEKPAGTYCFWQRYRIEENGNFASFAGFYAQGNEKCHLDGERVLSSVKRSILDIFQIGCFTNTTNNKVVLVTDAGKTVAEARKCLRSIRPGICVDIYPPRRQSYDRR